MRLYPLAGALALSMLISGQGWAGSTQFSGYAFEAYVIKANNKPYREFNDRGQTTLKVRPNQEYSIVVKNPLPVRVAVAVTIDGLNTIDGKRTTPRNAKKWMINPKASITISGWQTSKQTQRKFLFTADAESFAQWKEGKDKKPYTQNLGVIGVAWFWNSGELDRALHPPQPFADESAPSSDFAPGSSRRELSRAKAASAPRAGTGMGEERQHRVTSVAFAADAGMYALTDVLKIFYEFAELPPEPQPFLAEEDDEQFTPDMHQ